MPPTETNPNLPANASNGNPQRSKSPLQHPPSDYILGFRFNKPAMVETLKEVLGNDNIELVGPDTFAFIRIMTEQISREAYLYYAIGLNPETSKTEEVIVLDAGSEKALKKRLGLWQQRLEDAKKRRAERIKAAKEAEDSGVAPESDSDSDDSDDGLTQVDESIVYCLKYLDGPHIWAEMK